MTQTNIKLAQYLPVIQAAAAGQAIEFNACIPGTGKGWCTLDEDFQMLGLMRTYSPEHFRIKSEIHAPTTYEAVKVATQEELHELPEWKYRMAVAYRAGKQIQYLYPEQTGWRDCCQRGGFCAAADAGAQYRVKPEAKLHPWKATEVPVGALIKYAAGSLPTVICDVRGGVLGLCPQVTVLWDGKVRTISLTTLRDDWLYSTDQGKNWQRCGIVEQQ